MNKVTTLTVQAMKERSEKIVMLTAYDALFAALEDQAEIDIILVGDSAGNVVAGLETTLPVKMEHMLYHTSCVSRVVKRAMVIADMPFMSFQISPEHALKNAGRFMKESGAHGVKLEGGEVMASTVKRITDVGIPVMGHIGLTPQSIHRFGGYNIRGKKNSEAEQLMRDAIALEQAGAFAIVLEKVDKKAASDITKSLRIPTIGIGSGKECGGQVLVVYDMLGLFEQFKPKFVRRYLELSKEVTQAFQKYREDIKSGDFPGPNECYGAGDESPMI
ncbi:MAG: 3-methyl-2-oxobutanoate hydroxymethyltransferase [FCB group bacterium]|nr:3-methyl-2-oxobutanoate hydroxymethyltransferase [FCB group bacterium]